MRNLEPVYSGDCRLKNMYRKQISVLILWQVLLNLCKICRLEIPQDCVHFIKCPAADTITKTRPYDAEVIKLLQLSSCGNSKRRDMILCNKFTSLASKGDESRLLPKLEDCGKQSPSPKIAGGAVAELDDFAWLALLYYKNKVRIQHGCHGSLISNKYVVTAAHCLDSYQTRNIGNLHSVVLGEYDTTTPKDCKFLEYGGGCADPIQEFFIEHFQIHPNYEIEGARSDIALIRLRGTAKFTDFVQPICLPFNLAPVVKHETLWISGWGKTGSAKNSAVSTVKLKARIFPLPNAICYSYLSLRVDSTEMCAGSSDGTDTCVGDSGGPLMVTRVYNKEYKTFLIGVVSIGGTCGSGAAIYTNVALFTEWIRDNVKE